MAVVVESSPTEAVTERLVERIRRGPSPALLASSLPFRQEPRRGIQNPGVFVLAAAVVLEHVEQKVVEATRRPQRDAKENDAPPISEAFDQQPTRESRDEEEHQALESKDGGATEIAAERHGLEQTPTGLGA